ncbi:MAG: hypothetical protein ACLFNV_13040 [Desulfovibrionales bacterium]
MRIQSVILMVGFLTLALAGPGFGAGDQKTFFKGQAPSRSASSASFLQVERIGEHWFDQTHFHRLDSEAPRAASVPGSLDVLSISPDRYSGQPEQDLHGGFDLERGASLLRIPLSTRLNLDVGLAMGMTGPGERSQTWEVALPMTFSNLEIAPYAVSGKRSGSAPTQHSQWVGAKSRMRFFEPFSVLSDVAQGRIDGQDGQRTSRAFTLGLEMDTDLATSELFFTYQTLVKNGARANSPDAATSQEILSTALSDDFAGHFAPLPIKGIGLRLSEISVLENLNQSVSVLYATGSLPSETDPEFAARYLDEEDLLLGLSMDTRYAIYEHLAALVEVGVLNIRHNTAEENTSNWKFSLGVEYGF